MMTAKEFLKKELGSDLPGSLGNQTAHWMEKYYEYKTKENESKDNERSEEPLVRESNWIRIQRIGMFTKFRGILSRNTGKRRGK